MGTCKQAGGGGGSRSCRQLLSFLLASHVSHRYGYPYAEQVTLSNEKVPRCARYFLFTSSRRFSRSHLTLADPRPPPPASRKDSSQNLFSLRCKPDFAISATSESNTPRSFIISKHKGIWRGRTQSSSTPQTTSPVNPSITPKATTNLSISNPGSARSHEPV